jgi:hypothetical protein
MDDEMEKPSEDLMNIDLGDKRLNDRLIKSVEQLTACPGGSIQEACGGYDAKAFYRLLANAKYDIVKVENEYIKATVERAKRYLNEPHNSNKMILDLQDTTDVSLGGHSKTEGLGYSSAKSLGVRVHTSLAVTTEGIVIGLFKQTYHTRKDNKNVETTSKQKQEKSIKEKESYRWIESTQGLADLVGSEYKDRILIVCDREADFYWMFVDAITNCKNVLVRLHFNREQEDQKDCKTEETINNFGTAGYLEIDVPRNTEKNIKTRKALLEISFGPLTFIRPDYLQNSCEQEKVTINAIHVKEVEPENGFESGDELIEWYLGTTLEVNTIEDAVQMVEYYVKRWTVERFHFVLKSGCNIEQKTQQRSYDRVKSIILLKSIIAIYILNLTYIARVSPDSNSDIAFTPLETKILCASDKKSEHKAEHLNIQDAVKLLAKLGGFRGAPSDKAPGAKVLWRGFEKLAIMVEAYELFHNLE